jgi:hypothetical protein
MKVNGKGRECPVWCRIDHEAETETETETDRSCYGQEHTVKAEPSVAGAEASLGAYEKEPEISAWIYGPHHGGGFHGGRVTVRGSGGAERLAEALEAAVNLTEPQLRQLATQVRAAAAEAWPEPDKEAEAG